MYSHIKLVTKLPSLKHCASVAMVEEVPAAINPYPVFQNLGSGGSREDLFF
jgi:hypothetical protein